MRRCSHNGFRRQAHCVPVLAIILFVSFCCRAAEAELPTTGSLLVVGTTTTVETDLAPLLNLRRAQGWQIAVRRVRTTSSSLIAAIVTEEQRRTPALSHVLLVGSHFTLPKGRRPDYWVEGTAGSRRVLADDVYGLPDAKGVPRLVVGRLPTDDRPALRRLVAKTIRYEESVEQLMPEIFLLMGREHASVAPEGGGMSQQALVEEMSKAFVEETRLELPRLSVKLRSGFEGRDYYGFAEAPAVPASRRAIIESIASASTGMMCADSRSRRYVGHLSVADAPCLTRKEEAPQSARNF